MATDLRDIDRTLGKLVDAVRMTNKRLEKIEEALITKQFDEWLPPPIGTAYENMKGCVMISGADFRRLREGNKENGEDASHQV